MAAYELPKPVPRPPTISEVHRMILFGQTITPENEDSLGPRYSTESLVSQSLRKKCQVRLGVSARQIPESQRGRLDAVSVLLT